MKRCCFHESKKHRRCVSILKSPLDLRFSDIFQALDFNNDGYLEAEDFAFVLRSIGWDDATETVS